MSKNILEWAGTQLRPMFHLNLFNALIIMPHLNNSFNPEIPQVISALPGDHISQCIAMALDVAAKTLSPYVYLEHNGVKVQVTKSSSAESVLKDWEQGLDELFPLTESDDATPPTTPVVAAAQSFPFLSEYLRPEAAADYPAWKDKNSQDPYSLGVVRFTERWGALMEVWMANTPAYTVRDIAKLAASEADSEGVTGFMYGCAVQSLAHFWRHGDELRKWHNGEYGHQGDGVVNPAVFSIQP
jgi:hypothetical protein